MDLMTQIILSQDCCRINRYKIGKPPNESVFKTYLLREEWAFKVCNINSWEKQLEVARQNRSASL